MTGPDPSETKPARATKASKAAASATPGDPEVPAVPPLTETALAEAAPDIATEPALAPPAPAAPTPPPAAEPAVAPPAPAAPEPAAAAEPTMTPPAPPAGTPSAAAAAPAAPKLSTPDVAGAVDKAIDGLRTYLTVGEIVAGLGAFGILAIAWATFGVIFGHGGTWPSEMVMLLSVGLLAVLIIQNAHWHDFGPNYRLIVTGMCFALGLLAVLSLLAQLRHAVGGGTFDIGGLTWWAGAWVAVLGGVMVWREGR